MDDDMSFAVLCYYGDIEGVQAAIDNGVDVNEASEEESEVGETGLMNALCNNHNYVVWVLLQHPQIDINKVDLSGSSALHWAMTADNDEGLAALLAHHDELTTFNQRDDMHGRTPIMEAVLCDSVNCFQLLLTNPLVDLDTRDGYKRVKEQIQRWGESNLLSHTIPFKCVVFATNAQVCGRPPRANL